MRWWKGGRNARLPNQACRGQQDTLSFSSPPPDDSSSPPSTADTDGKGPRVPAQNTPAAPSVAERDGEGDESGSWLDRNRDDLITYGAALLISLGIRT